MATAVHPTSHVPFLGWSQAAANFRSIAATHAAHRGSVLFLGPVGVGKRAMAKAWWALSGRSPADFRVIDLDSRTADIQHPCVAISTQPLPEGLSCRDLASGSTDFVLDGPTALTAEVVSPFSLRLYLPPVCERSIDILPLLAYFNDDVFPKQGARRFARISTDLICDLLEAAWPANCVELLGYTLALGRCATGDTLEHSSDLQLAKTPAILEATADEDDELHLPVHRGVLAKCGPSVSFNELADLALRILLRAFGEFVMVGVLSCHQVQAQAYSDYHICFRDLERFQDRCFSTPIPSVTTFRECDIDQYLGELNSKWWHPWSFEWGDRAAEKRRPRGTVARGPEYGGALGATLRSLHSGFSIASDVVPDLARLDPQRDNADRVARLTASQNPIMPDHLLVSRQAAGLDLETAGKVGYRGQSVSLSGYGWDVLKELTQAPNLTCTAATLWKNVWGEKRELTNSDTIRSAVRDARKALKSLMEMAKIENPPKDPIPTVRRGHKRLAWRLDLP